MRKQYLIGIKENKKIDYRIVYNPDAMKYKFWFGDKLKKPDFIIELPSKFGELEKLIKKN